MIRLNRTHSIRWWRAALRRLPDMTEADRTRLNVLASSYTT